MAHPISLSTVRPLESREEGRILKGCLEQQMMKGQGCITWYNSTAESYSNSRTPDLPHATFSGPLSNIFPTVYYASVTLSVQVSYSD